jgi:hypothetical protein
MPNDCQCECCYRCNHCGHRADEHLAGDGPCMMRGCQCGSVNNLWHQSGWELEQFAEFDTETFDKSYVSKLD